MFSLTIFCVHLDLQIVINTDNLKLVTKVNLTNHVESEEVRTSSPIEDFLAFSYSQLQGKLKTLWLC